MGFWSKFGRIASVAAPIAATVLTGGAAAPTLFAGGAGGIMSKIAAAAPMIGAGAAAASSAAAKNRGTNVDIEHETARINDERERLRQSEDQNKLAQSRLGLDATHTGNVDMNAYYQTMMDREKVGDSTRENAFRDLQHAEYVANNTGAQPFVTASGKTLAPGGFGPKASTDAEKAGAAAMRDEVMKRLQGGNPIGPIDRPNTYTPGQIINDGPRIWDEQYKVDPRYRKPSIWEQIGNVAGPVFTAYGKQKSPLDENPNPGPVYRPEQ